VRADPGDWYSDPHAGRGICFPRIRSRRQTAIRVRAVQAPHARDGRFVQCVADRHSCFVQAIGAAECTDGHRLRSQPDARKDAQSPPRRAAEHEGVRLRRSDETANGSRQLHRHETRRFDVVRGAARQAADLPLLPGQERINARYSAAKGAAIVCQTPSESLGSVLGLLEHPERIGQFQQAAATLCREGASDRIVQPETMQ
jgi:hypothetical protein